MKKTFLYFVRKVIERTAIVYKLPYSKAETSPKKWDNAYRFGFNGKEKDNEAKGVGNSLDFGERIYDSRLGRWLSLDPMATKFPAWSAYNFTLNNPILLQDPDGREPTKSQAGTAKGFIAFLDNTRSKMGTLRGAAAHDAMMRLGKTEMNWKHMRPEPMTTNPFNNSKDKYIYTQKGGWLDMAHFMFYAGKAYDYKMQKESAQKVVNSNGFSRMMHGQELLIRKANMDPVGEAVQDGYRQEMSDRFAAKHSAYSYEDLPSDKLGADFGANHFDPNSKLSLGEQLGNYLNGLGATNPENAPNYSNLPASDDELGDKPSETNHTTNPMHTSDKGTDKHVTEKDPQR